MNCPKCETEFLKAATVRAVEVDQCQNCGGVWFDQSELSDLLGEQAWNIESLLEGKNSRSADNTRKGKCPRCQKPMTRVLSQLNRAVTMDTCLDCRGVWLDGGEFSSLYRSNT